MGTISRQLLMGKKQGDLAPVWMAAHFPKRIKKELVEQTNIVSSVDKILVDQLPFVTYRILGYLLLGVVRIYSKKVDYLLVDCNHSLNEWKVFSDGREKGDINFMGMCLPESSGQRSKLKAIDVIPSESSGRNNCNLFFEAMRAQLSSISLPQNFELDAFDLEIMEDDSNNSSNDHVKPHLELVLHDAWENYQTPPHTFGEDHASASTSAMITTVDPETSVEKFRHGFFLEECLDPMVLSEVDEELVRASSPVIELEPECNYNNTGPSDMISEGLKNSNEHLDEGCPTTVQTVVSDMASVENIALKPSPNKSQLSVMVDVTPQSKAPAVSGQRKSERLAGRTPAVRTPSVREPARASRASRKRKSVYVYDYPLVVPNEVYKTWVSDASDLVRKRQAPVGVFDQNEPRCSDSFLQPLIPINVGFNTDYGSVASTSQAVVAQEAEETAEPASLKTDELGPLNLCKASEVTEAEVIAPLTPATQSASLRFDDMLSTSKVNRMGPTSSCESGEKARSPIKDVDLVKIQQEEGPSSLGQDTQENVHDAEKWSAATKRVGRYLQSNFVHCKEKGEEEAVNLTHILKQKTKKESAKFFYQILVLKTGGYIDVKQEKAYGEIRVKQSPKLKDVFAGGSSRD